MYFINFAKCSCCRQKKSVASSKQNRKKICVDCDRGFYLKAAESQKKHWLNSKSNTYNSK
ncbi:MAG: hypothetical protein CMO97_05125 [Woeseia sp.]|nr:hypothetical protein [Woeseia sp.]